MKKISYLLFCLFILFLNPLHSQEVAKADTLKTFVPKPSFPGGEKALERYLADNMSYPQLAEENCIQGTVVVKFVVTQAGKVTNPDIIMYAHPLLNKEALRLISAMPTWVGGKKDEEVALPISFKLDCESESFCEYIADSLLTRKNIEEVNDMNHPDKALIEGMWKFKSFDIDVNSKDKKEVKEIKKRFLKVTKGEGRTLYQELKQMKLVFHEDNSILIEIDGVMDGIYRLRDNKILMHSTIGGSQVMDYEIRGDMLRIGVAILTPNPKIKGTAKIIFKRVKEK